MNIFAHGGVDHTTSAEATAHTSGDIAWEIILVTVVVVAFLAAAVWAVRNFSSQTVSSKGKDDS